MDEIWFFLPGIIALGLITSWEDWREGKIRNKWVFLGLMYSAIINLAIISSHHLSSSLNQRYPFELLSNLIFSLILGFLMWYLKLWTAGDGKLFIALSALIPLSSYSIGYLPWIPSFSLFTNIFIIGFIWYMLKIILSCELRDLIRSVYAFIKKQSSPSYLLQSITYLFSTAWILESILRLVGVDDPWLMVFFLTLLFSSFIRKLTYISIGASILRLFVDTSIFSLAFLGDFMKLIVLWTIMRYLVGDGLITLQKKAFFKEVSTSELKPGMVLAEEIDPQGKKKRKSLLEIKKRHIDEEAEGVTKEQISMIRMSGIKSIKVSITVPFAPIIFIGALMTIIAKGNILIVVAGSL